MDTRAPSVSVIRFMSRHHRAAAASRRRRLPADPGALGIIRTALAEVDAAIEDVVRNVVYVTDIVDASLVAWAHRETFGHIMPASTLVQVAALLQPNMRIEVEAYAVTDEEEKQCASRATSTPS
jgi:hypothetical protein